MCIIEAGVYAINNYMRLKCVCVWGGGGDGGGGLLLERGYRNQLVTAVNLVDVHQIIARNGPIFRHGIWIRPGGHWFWITECGLVTCQGRINISQNSQGGGGGGVCKINMNPIRSCSLLKAGFHTKT